MRIWICSALVVQGQHLQMSWCCCQAEHAINTHHDCHDSSIDACTQAIPLLLRFLQQNAATCSTCMPACPTLLKAYEVGVSKSFRQVARSGNHESESHNYNEQLHMHAMVTACCVSPAQHDSMIYLTISNVVSGAFAHQWPLKELQKA